MPEGIPLTTLIKVIIGAIGACQMPSLPSQLPRSPWTQLLTSSPGPGETGEPSGEVWRAGPPVAVGGGWGGRYGVARAYGTCPPLLSGSACAGLFRLNYRILLARRVARGEYGKLSVQVGKGGRGWVRGGVIHTGKAEKSGSSFGAGSAILRWRTAGERHVFWTQSRKSGSYMKVIQKAINVTFF